MDIGSASGSGIFLDLDPGDPKRPDPYPYPHTAFNIMRILRPSIPGSLIREITVSSSELECSNGNNWNLLFIPDLTRTFEEAWQNCDKYLENSMAAEFQVKRACSIFKGKITNQIHTLLFRTI